MSSSKEAIKEIITLFDEAEDKIKEVERLTGDISIPAINQLRYVAYHLARSHSEEEFEKINAEIDKAKRHCMRSIYDAHEIGILYLLRYIKDFKEKYTPFSSSVLEVLPDYVRQCQDANKAKNFINQVKEENRNNRYAHYRDCEPHYKVLKDIVENFDEAEPLVNQKIFEKTKSDQKKTRSFVLVVLSLLVSVLLLSLKIFSMSF